MNVLNLAGVAPAIVDRQIAHELHRCRITPVTVPRHTDREVAYSIEGQLTLMLDMENWTESTFRFRRAWTYWTVEGPVPLDTARELWGDPVGRTDIRVNGHAGRIEPTEDVATRHMPPPPQGVAIYDDLVETTSIDLYHIDTEIGLRVFVDALGPAFHRGPVA